VSTILRSLKRVEKESIGAQQAGMFSPLKTRTVMHDAVRFAWLKSRLVQWGALGIVFLAAAVVFYTYVWPDRQPPSQVHSVRPMVAPPAGATRQTTLAPANQAVQPQMPSHATESIPLVQSMEPSPAMPSRMESASGPAPSVSARQPEHGSISPIDQNSFDQPAPPRAMDGTGTSLSAHSDSAPAGDNFTRSPSELLSQPTAEIATESEPARYKQQKRQFANAERMTDGRLKVQAIVWSTNADERMAVVNSRIVREGTVLEGFSILGIGQDALYVSEAGRLLAVPFGKP
jgi:hypothetical protein